MARTQQQIQTDIDAVSAALSSLYSGQRLTTLIVGTGDSQRRYTYQEITVENLQAALNGYRQELMELTPEIGMTFRSSCSMPLVIGKSGIR